MRGHDSVAPPMPESLATQKRSRQVRRLPMVRTKEPTRIKEVPEPRRPSAEIWAPDRTKVWLRNVGVLRLPDKGHGGKRLSVP